MNKKSRGYPRSTTTNLSLLVGEVGWENTLPAPRLSVEQFEVSEFFSFDAYSNGDRTSIPMLIDNAFDVIPLGGVESDFDPFVCDLDAADGVKGDSAPVATLEKLLDFSYVENEMLIAA